MHEEIMEFPNTWFYEKQLAILPVQADPARKQQGAPPIPFRRHESELEKLLCSRRRCSFPPLATMRARRARPTSMKRV